MTYPRAERRTTHCLIISFLFRLTCVLSPLGHSTEFHQFTAAESQLHCSFMYDFKVLKTIPLYFLNGTQDDRLNHDTAAPPEVSKMQQRFLPIESGSQGGKAIRLNSDITQLNFAHRFGCFTKGLFCRTRLQMTVSLHDLGFAPLHICIFVLLYMLLPRKI